MAGTQTPVLPVATMTVLVMHQCEECATVTTDPPNAYGNYYCTRHNTKDEQ